MRLSFFVFARPVCPASDNSNQGKLRLGHHPQRIPSLLKNYLLTLSYACIPTRVAIQQVLARPEFELEVGVRSKPLPGGHVRVAAPGR